MKKFYVLLAAVLLALCFAGCSEYTPPIEGGEGDNTGITKPDPTPGGDKPEEAKFTAALIYEGMPFIPDEPVSVLWNDRDSSAIYSAPVGEGGKADVSGLDGDFKVTLSALPAKRDIYGNRIEYTYDPNAYSVNNDERDVSITLYELSSTKGSGTDFYSNAIDIELDARNIAAFRATINYSGNTVYFRYSPKESAVYSLRTMVDVTANVINPILEVYSGTVGYVNPKPTQTVDGGGAENTYTKNPVWEMAIGKEYLGNVFIFAIRAEGLNANAFPIDIDFILDKDREFEGGGNVYEKVVPEENFKQAGTEAGSFKYAAYLKPNNELDERMFRLWKKEDGGDGYYHFFSETVDAITGEVSIEYGKTLYAKINKDFEFVQTETSTGFTDGKMAKRFSGKDYSEFISQYALYVNGDGAYPVTEELKTFLQGFSVSQGYFRDGDGYAETEGNKYNSSESSQWLFACGYYG